MEENKYTNILDALKDIHDRMSKIGDDIITINDLTSDTEVKSLITDLANSAYVLAQDTEDVAQTYADIQAEDAEELGDETEEESVEVSDDELEPNV